MRSASTAFEPFLSGLVCDRSGRGVMLEASYSTEELCAVDLPFELPKTLASAVGKRRAEFAAGRLLAHLAQAELGRQPLPIEAGPSRAPSWPEGLNGSISHSKGRVCVWVADQPALIGIDIEEIASGDALRAICKSVLSSQEQHRIGSDPIALTAAFSAKETLYKALYPKVRRFFGFGAAEIVETQENALLIELREELRPELRSGKPFQVELRRSACMVQTKLWVDLPL